MEWLKSETQDQGKGIIHSPKLISVESPSGTSEALWIHDSGLLDEDPRLTAIELDRRTERG